MKINKIRIREIIKEVLLTERSTGSPNLVAEEEALRRAAVDFAQKYMLIMRHGHSDRDATQVRAAVIEIIDTVLG